MRQVNATLLQVDLSGANSRRIRWALKPLLAGSPLAKSSISRIVQGLKAEVAAWQGRALAELDLVYLFLNGSHLKVRVGGTVSSVPALAVLGVQRSGQKVAVHFSLRGGESTAAWATVCKQRWRPTLHARISPTRHVGGRDNTILSPEIKPYATMHPHGFPHREAFSTSLGTPPGPGAPSNQGSVFLQKPTSMSITGTSMSTPTTVARAAPELRPKSITAVAMATSK